MRKRTRFVEKYVSPRQTDRSKSSYVKRMASKERIGSYQTSPRRRRQFLDHDMTMNHDLLSPLSPKNNDLDSSRYTASYRLMSEFEKPGARKKLVRETTYDYTPNLAYKHQTYHDPFLNLNLINMEFESHKWRQMHACMKEQYGPPEISESVLGNISVNDQSFQNKYKDNLFNSPMPNLSIVSTRYMSRGR
jgi:hypothetical protein